MSMLLRTVLLALSLSTPVLSAAAQTPPAPTPTANTTVLSVAATGEVSRRPDLALLSAGVITQAADANTAMRDNAVRMDKVMTALRAAGIEGRDVQTSGITLNPQYRYGDNQPPTIIGYQASNTVNVKVRDLARLGRVLDTLVAQGANQINGPSFTIEKPEAAMADARRVAVQKAQAMARTYADALGLKVLRVVSLNEGGSNLPRPLPGMAKLASMPAMAEADTAVAPGENTVSVTLEAVFELGH
ncbi:SIMPL domain-containing protein [Thermomonas hydrothermalis]|nr:SIMPL domain-containing protein [Thermomonas hydrothermalis]